MADASKKLTAMFRTAVLDEGQRANALALKRADVHRMTIVVEGESREDVYKRMWRRQKRDTAVAMLERERAQRLYDTLRAEIDGRKVRRRDLTDEITSAIRSYRGGLHPGDDQPEWPTTQNLIRWLEPTSGSTVRRYLDRMLKTGVLQRGERYGENTYDFTRSWVEAEFAKIMEGVKERETQRDVRRANA